MSNIENKGVKCERCQSENAVIICQDCQPFHYFCIRCDSIVHSMRVKSFHLRQNINDLINKTLNSPYKDKNNNSTAKFEDVKEPSKNYFRTLTPKNQKIRIDNKNINENKENILMNNGYDGSYGKDYLSEINRIHLKEKEALQYKINTLENSIERLKLYFQNETKLMEERMNNILREKKNMEEKYNKLIDMNKKERNEKLQILINENNALKEKNRILEEKGKEKEDEMTKNIYECNNQIEKLKNELSNARKDNSDLHKNHMNKVSEMVKNNNDNIKNLNEIHKKEMDEIYYDGKFKNEKLIKQVENDLNKIELLKKENEKLRENTRKLEKDNEMLLFENQRMKNKIEELSKNLKISYELNNNIKQNYEKIRIENNNMKNDFDYYENTINGLKRELFLMNDTYQKKEKDFNYLLEQSEKIRKDFSENMFNNEELEYSNRALKKENDELKKTINSINEKQRICQCQSYNY